jgi:hypothetical protein
MDSAACPACKEKSSDEQFAEAARNFHGTDAERTRNFHGTDAEAARNAAGMEMAL